MIPKIFFSVSKQNKKFLYIFFNLLHAMRPYTTGSDIKSQAGP